MEIRLKHFEMACDEAGIPEEKQDWFYWQRIKRCRIGSLEYFLRGYSRAGEGSKIYPEYGN